MGPLFRENIPDMILDYHSLGKTEGSKYDAGDMECIVPANTTKWGMDEQIHLDVAKKMVASAEAAGYPYEIHTLEDIYCYYFGQHPLGSMAWQPIKEKNYLLQTQDAFDGYDAPFDEAQPEERVQPITGYSGYTNYTCGPAYRKWHSLVLGIETNHWSMTNPTDIAINGMVPCRTLLKLGSTRSPWEKDTGYPTNIIQGDFRISIRPVGKNAAERRASRVLLWNERQNFNLPWREMPDEENHNGQGTFALAIQAPLEFALCLRMRQNPIHSITMGGKKVNYETFQDSAPSISTSPW